jgi:regulatory protein
MSATTGTITTVRRNVKNAERCTVFVDGEFFAACPIDVAVALGLRKGLPMTEELADRLRREDRRVTFRQKAWSYALYKPRTVRQVREHLQGLECSEAEIESIITWLASFNAVNDVAYADAFLAAARERKPLSRRAAQQKLLAKGVEREVIEAAIEKNYQPEVSREAALRVAQRKLATLRDTDPRVLRDKLVRFLQYRGYSWDEIKAAVDEVIRSVRETD